MSALKNKTPKTESKNQPMLFDKTNYILIGVSILVLASGFSLMTGTENIYNSTKLTVAPIVVFLGFILGIVAIFYKKKTSE
jgi:uncharacterized membrane protein